MQEYKPFKSGKVREIYDIGDSLIMVASDRISAFDHILKNTITDKGAVLTRLSKFWFEFTKDVIPNHMLSVDPADMPEFFAHRNCRQEHEMPEARHDSCRMHRPWVYYRLRLGILSKKWNRLRHHPAGRSERIPETG